MLVVRRRFALGLTTVAGRCLTPSVADRDRALELVHVRLYAADHDLAIPRTADHHAGSRTLHPAASAHVEQE